MLKIERIGNQDLIDAIKNNNGYCLCKIEQIADNKCMCKEFREQETSGICHCGLYKKTITKD